MLCCGVWCGVVWWGVVWCGVVHGVVWCGGVLYGAGCGVVWYGAVWCGMVRCGVVMVHCVRGSFYQFVAARIVNLEKYSTKV